MPGGPMAGDPGRGVPASRITGHGAAAEALAAHAGVPFEGVWLHAEPDTLRSRVAGRQGDASDADLGVLESQLALDPGEIGWTRDAAGALSRLSE